MGLSLTHIILLLIVVLIVFGVGRLPQVMGDLGKGIRNFKAGLDGDVDASAKKAKDDDTSLPPPAS